MKDLAARLIAFETGRESAAATGPPAAFQVCERLRPHLATLMGKAGFRAVLLRAIAVAGTEMPGSGALQVKADGSLDGWDDPEAPLKANERNAGGVLVVAQLLGLLVAFIGETLTLRLVRDVWPKLSLEGLEFTQGDHP
jgi:hypothetical protein